MSVYVVVQNQMSISDYVDEIIKRFPPSSVIIGRGVPVVPKVFPVLTSKWLVVVYVGSKIQQQIKVVLGSESFADFVFVTSMRNGDLQSSLQSEGIDFVIRDTTTPSVEMLVEYVRENLGVSEPLAKSIVKRSGNYETSVVKNVAILSVLDPQTITTTLLKRYLPERPPISFNYLYRFLVGFGGEYSLVVKLVKQYQYSVQTLVKYLVGRLDTDIMLFDLIMDAQITKENYRTQAIELKRPLYVVEEALQLFDQLSYERLVAIRLVLSQVSKNSVIEFLYRLRSVTR